MDVSVLFLALALHEIGHVAAAWWLGFSIKGLSVGPVRLQRGPAAWRLSLERRIWFDGQALAYPKDDHDLARRLRIMTASGPLVNLATAFACLGILATEPVFPPVLHQLLAGMFLMSLFVALLSGVPPFGRTGMRAFSDGETFVRLVGADADAWAARFAALLALNAGVRPRDWPEGWLRRMRTREEASIEVRWLSYSNLYYGWLDRGRVAEATEAFRRLCSLIPELPPGIQAILKYETAYFEAYYLKNTVSARHALEQAEVLRGSFSVPGTRERASSALALAEGAYARAHELAQAGLVKVMRASEVMPNGALAFEQAVLEELIQASAPHNSDFQEPSRRAVPA